MPIALRALPNTKITYFKITLTLKTVLPSHNPCKLTNKMDCIYLLWKIKLTSSWCVQTNKEHRIDS